MGICSLKPKENNQSPETDHKTKYNHSADPLGLFISSHPSASFHLSSDHSLTGALLILLHSPHFHFQTKMNSSNFPSLGLNFNSFPSPNSLTYKPGHFPHSGFKSTESPWFIFLPVIYIKILSINRGMNKEAVVHIYNGISSVFKKKEIMPFPAT